jgi:phosphoribosyl-ATP pyrophosphohydrolase
MRDALDQLEATIARRRGADPAHSYVAKLMGKGRLKIAQKVGEEAVETVIAATSGDRAGVVMESADLMFHLAVLLAEMGLSFNDVCAELERRDGLSGLAEKAARPQD